MSCISPCRTTSKTCPNRPERFDRKRKTELDTSNSTPKILFPKMKKRIVHKYANIKEEKEDKSVEEADCSDLDDDSYEEESENSEDRAFIDDSEVISLSSDSDSEEEEEKDDISLLNGVPVNYTKVIEEADRREKILMKNQLSNVVLHNLVSLARRRAMGYRGEQLLVQTLNEKPKSAVLTTVEKQAHLQELHKARIVMEAMSRHSCIRRHWEVYRPIFMKGFPGLSEEEKLKMEQEFHPSTLEA